MLNSMFKIFNCGQQNVTRKSSVYLSYQHLSWCPISVDWAALTLRLVYSTALVLFTENDPFGTLTWHLAAPLSNKIQDRTLLKFDNRFRTFQRQCLKSFALVNETCQQTWGNSGENCAPVYSSNFKHYGTPSGFPSTSSWLRMVRHLVGSSVYI